MNRGGEESSRAVWSVQDAMRGSRKGFGGLGGEAGLTGQQQRCLVPPGFLLKTWPPSRSRVSSFSSTTTLSFIFLSSFVPSLHHPPVPAPFLYFSHFFLCLLPPTPPHVWSITDTQQWAERRWDEEMEGDKSPEMQWSNESGWY